MKPTEDDLRRDLSADLELCEAASPGPWRVDGDDGRLNAHVEMIELRAEDGRAVCTVWDRGKKQNRYFIAASREGWPAAVRRALAAEAFKTWVHGYLDAHGVPHHPPGTHGAEGCRVGDRMDWLTARLCEAEAVLNDPAVALFDGREPTANERHLLNLLSWREKEAAGAKAECAGLRAKLSAACDRIAAQGELLTRHAEDHDLLRRTVLAALDGVLFDWAARQQEGGPERRFADGGVTALYELRQCLTAQTGWPAMTVALKESQP